MAGEPSQPDRGLILVVQASSALSLATLAALLCSVRSVSPSIQFRFSPLTVVAFVLAGALSIGFWRLVFRLSAGQGQNEAQDRSGKAWLAALGSVLAVGLLVAFLYPLKDFSREKQLEFTIGGASALFFLSVLGFIFWKLIQFLEKDSASNG